MRRALFLLAATISVTTSAAAADGITIDGRVDHASTLTPADLAKLPQVTEDVSFETAHGTVSGHFTGVLLWTLIDQVGVKADPAKQKHHLQDTILVTGRDGYSVAVAMAEIDPSFEDKQVLIGTDVAKPGGGLRLIVPNDKMGGRDVHDVARIEVR